MIQELLLADGIEVNIVSPLDGRHLISLVHLTQSLPVLILLLEDGRVEREKPPLPGLFNLLDSTAENVVGFPGVEPLLSVCDVFTRLPDLPPPSLHYLHELLKYGCDPNWRFRDGSLPIDHCRRAGAVEACNLLRSYMKGEPIQQRLVEKVVVDAQGRHIQHRLYGTVRILQ